MIYAIFKRLVYRLARKLHAQDVRRNRSAGARKGWETRKSKVLP